MGRRQALPRAHLSLNITHHQQLVANPSLDGAQRMVLSSKILEQSQLGNTWGVQRSAEDWRELLGTTGVAAVPPCWAPVA